MSKKKPTKRSKKPTLKKKATKKRPPLKTTFTHVRGSRAKSINFSKGSHDPEKIEQTLKAMTFNEFDYLRRRNKPNGKNYKPPQGITVIITVKKGKNTYHYTKLSEPDFVVNKQSVKDFTTNTVAELSEKFDTRQNALEGDDFDGEPESEANQYIDNLDPSFIQSVTVRFLYGK